MAIHFKPNNLEQLVLTNIGLSGPDLWSKLSLTLPLFVCPGGTFSSTQEGPWRRISSTMNRAFNRKKGKRAQISQYQTNGLSVSLFWVEHSLTIFFRSAWKMFVTSVMFFSLSFFKWGNVVYCMLLQDEDVLRTWPYGVVQQRTIQQLIRQKYLYCVWIIFSILLCCLHNANKIQKCSLSGGLNAWKGNGEPSAPHLYVAICM